MSDDNENEERISFPQPLTLGGLLELQGFKTEQQAADRWMVRAWAHLLRSVPNVHASLGRDPDHQQELALAEHLAAYSHPPAPRTDEGVRAMLRERSEKCSDSCPGWDVFDSDQYGLHIAACDECVRGSDLPLYDEDVARLPEAKLALADGVVKRIRQSFLRGINRRLLPALRLEVEVRGSGDVEVSTRSGRRVFLGPPSEAIVAVEGMAAMAILLGESR